MIAKISAFCLQYFKPDLIFYLDLSPEQGLYRVTNRGTTDRIEQESLSFFTRIQQSYRQIVQTMTNVIVIDASQPIEIVQELLIKQLKIFLADNDIVRKI